MKQELLLSWRPHLFFSIPSSSKFPTPLIIRATSGYPVNDETATILTAKEKRQLRNERRDRNSLYNWREEVEERLMKKPKKRYKSWTEELNLDNLALLGPQWWVVRVSRVNGHETADRMSRALVRNFPDVEFKLYAPAVHMKKKLKTGAISVKPKALFPGCVFLNCVMNKDIHDFIRECDGVGGFIGSKVGNTKRQINKPRPVSSDDMEVIFEEAKKEQEKANRTFEEEHPGEGAHASENVSLTSTKGISKSKRRSTKASGHLKDDPSMADLYRLLPGSSVRVLSGAFADFSGTLKKLDPKTRLATVGLTLFGKETLADVDVSEIVLEAN